jgi:hypothetical protein
MRKAGGMVQLDTSEWGTFYGKLVDAFHIYLAGAAVLSKYQNKKGTGILSEAGAYALKAIIQDTIDGGPIHGVLIRKPTQDMFRAFKQEHGYFDTTAKFTGKMYQSIVATKRGDIWVVGVNKQATAQRIGWRNKRHGPKIKVEEYAAWVNDGTDVNPARPVFTNSIRYFISEKIPELKDLVEKSFRQVAKLKLTGWDGPSTAKGGVTGAMQIPGWDPDADFSQEQVNHAISQGDVGEGSDDRRLNSKYKKEVQQVSEDLRKWAEANGVDPITLKKIR